MTKLNEKRTEMAYDYAGLSPEDTPTSFNMTCFAEKAAFNCGWNSAIAEVMPQVHKLVGALELIGSDTSLSLRTKDLVYEAEKALTEWQEYVGKE